MIKVGDMVKIADIGELAVCLETGTGEVFLELGGSRFWIAEALCESVDAMLEEMLAA